MMVLNNVFQKISSFISVIGEKSGTKVFVKDQYNMIYQEFQFVLLSLCIYFLLR